MMSASFESPVVMRAPRAVARSGEPPIGAQREVLAELVRRGAERIDHGGRTLSQHLLGVHAVLERWGQPERVRIAGLLHSVYSTEAFHVAVFARGDRARVREIAGEAAERLAFAFGACRRDVLLAAAQRDGGRVEVASRWGGAVALDRRDLAELMILHAANLAEQVSGLRGEPAPWLAAASGFLAAARDAEVAPPVLAGGAVAITPLEETALLHAYRALWSASAAPRPAGRRALARAIAAPVGEPLVLAGLVALAGEDGASDPAALGRLAESALDAWGTAWDKRLRLDRWRELARLVVQGGEARGAAREAAARRVRAALVRARRSPARLWAELDAVRAFEATPASVVAVPAELQAQGAAPGLPSRFVQYLAGLRTNAERPLMPFYPGLSAKPLHDPRAFPIVRELERLAPAIADEARALAAAGAFHDESEEIGRTGRWSVAFLLEMGRRNADNLARCPTVRALLDRHRVLAAQPGSMYFSRLEPGTRVAEHQGPTNLRVRCHLGLDVPERCGLRVGGVTAGWTEGRCVVIDDSFPHEVWNDGDRGRVVLVVDLWHPDLGEDEVELLAGLERHATASAAVARQFARQNESVRAGAARGTSTRDTACADATHDRALAPEASGGHAEALARRLEELRGAPDDAKVLSAVVGDAMKAGELRLAAEHARRSAAACRGTRWYPERRADDPPLPPSIPWRRELTPGKLLHDIEQLAYLEGRGVLSGELSPVIEAYEGLLERLEPLGPEARVPLVGAALAEVGHVYNRIVHVRETPRVARALSGSWDPAEVERTFFDRRPAMVVVDDFLSREALESLRAFCLESTVWSENRYRYGRLGAMFQDGFNCPLLVQLAEEIRAALPRLVPPELPTRQIWGYKYAPNAPAETPHADFARVNVNVWITPDDANLDPSSGGLLVYDVTAPKDWDHATFNNNAGVKILPFLREKNARPRHIPYRCNRALVFDSDVFHATPAIRFKSGYENRRINVTALFGARDGRS